MQNNNNNNNILWSYHCKFLFAISLFILQNDASCFEYSVMCCWHCRDVFLFRLRVASAFTLASAFRLRSTSLKEHNAHILLLAGTHWYTGAGSICLQICIDANSSGAYLPEQQYICQS